MVKFLLIQLIIIVVTFSPLISALGAGAIASHLGCTLNEGFVSPCEVFGVDIGSNLYSAFVLGWLTLMTLPIGAIVWFVHLCYGFYLLLKSWQKRRNL